MLLRLNFSDSESEGILKSQSDLSEQGQESEYELDDATPSLISIRCITRSKVKKVKYEPKAYIYPTKVDKPKTKPAKKRQKKAQTKNETKVTLNVKNSKKLNKIAKLSTSLTSGLIVNHTFTKKAVTILPEDEFEDITTIKAKQEQLQAPV